MPSKPLRLNEAYYAFSKMKNRAGESDSMSFEIRSSVLIGYALSLTLFNCIIYLTVCHALQHYPVVRSRTRPMASWSWARPTGRCNNYLRLSICAIMHRWQKWCLHSFLVNSTKLSCLMASSCRMLINLSNSIRLSLQMARPPKWSQAGLTFPVPHSLVYNPVFVSGVNYRCLPRAEPSRDVWSFLLSSDCKGPLMNVKKLYVPSRHPLLRLLGYGDRTLFSNVRSMIGFKQP